MVPNPGHYPQSNSLWAVKEVELVDGSEVVLSDDDLEDMHPTEVEGSEEEEISGGFAQNCRDKIYPVDKKYNSWSVMSVCR